ncbi:MAG: DUF3307 domain-containing protein [Clostridia bacterium]|nr:DUF3307 domain-containing protein [Clostridia bacterium]
MKVLLCMIYLHLIDDYVLQGILAKLKQKDFWEHCGQNYVGDYGIALLEHGFMNSFLVHIPIYLWLCKNEVVLFASVLLLGNIHATIDDLKANQKKINLTQDQVLHIVLIVIWWVLFTLFGGMI